MLGYRTMPSKRPARSRAIATIGCGPSDFTRRCSNTNRATCRLSLVALVALVTLLGSAACSQDPGVRKQKALERSEQYLKDNRVNEAIIELRNALQIDPELAPRCALWVEPTPTSPGTLTRGES